MKKKTTLESRVIGGLDIVIIINNKDGGGGGRVSGTGLKK